MVNENYRTMMSDSINLKTIEAIKSCLQDLEIVFNEATGYFNKRENILALNDKFYGTLSQSRRQMSDETREMVVSTGELYRTLSDASETLFMQIWNERKKYDASIRMHKALSNIGGGTLGGAAGAGIGLAGLHLLTGGGAVAASSAAAAGGTALAAGSGTAAVGGTALAAGTTSAAVAGASVFAIAGLVVIGVIAGAVLFRYISKSFFDPKSADKMEENTRKCIEQFKKEVDHTRIEMIEQVTGQITTIFENELANVDNCFTEFRMSVNIDERKIPLLEQRMQEAENLLLKIETI